MSNHTSQTSWYTAAQREIRLQPNIDCSFMISHSVDQLNPSCAIKFATMFVNQHQKRGIGIYKTIQLLRAFNFFKHKNRHVYKNKVDFGKSSKGKKQSISKKKTPCIIAIMRPKMKFRLVAVERLKLLYEH